MKLNVSSNLFKRILIVMLIFFIGIGCGGATSDDNGGGTADDGRNSNIPPYPPGFILPKELGELKIDDYTKDIKKYLPNVEYSAIWTLTKQYPNKWKEMTNKEKNEFKLLSDTTIKALSKGVIRANGKLEVFEFFSGIKKAQWKVTHKKMQSLSIWWVQCHFSEVGLEKVPEIGIYIAHTEIK